MNIEKIFRPKVDADFRTDLPLDEAIARLRRILSDGPFGNLREFKRIVGVVSEKQVKLRLYAGRFPPFLPATVIFFEGGWEKADQDLRLRGSFKLSDVILPFIIFWELGILGLVVPMALMEILKHGINAPRLELLAVGLVFAIGGAAAPYIALNYLSDTEIDGLTEAIKHALRPTNGS